MQVLVISYTLHVKLGHLAQPEQWGWEVGFEIVYLAVLG